MTRDEAEDASTLVARVWSLTGMTERSVFVRTTVKDVASVLTRDQVRVLLPEAAQEVELLGEVTWKADAESAAAKSAKRADAVRIVSFEMCWCKAVKFR